MKTQILLLAIPFAVVFAAFLIAKLWVARNRDPLLARYRGLGVLILVLGLVLSAAVVLRFVAPESAPTGPLGLFLGALLIFALLHRRRLARQLAERG